MLTTSTTHTAVINDKEFTFPVCELPLCAPLRTVRVVDMRNHTKENSGCNDYLLVLVGLDDYTAVAADEDYMCGDVSLFPNGWDYDMKHMDAHVPLYHSIGMSDKSRATFVLEGEQKITNIYLPTILRSGFLEREILIANGLRYEEGCIRHTEDEDNDLWECRCEWCLAVPQCLTIPVFVPEIDATLEVIDGRGITVKICNDGFLRLMQNEGVLGEYCGFMQNPDHPRGLMLSSAPNTQVFHVRPHIGFPVESDWVPDPEDCIGAVSSTVIKRMEPCSFRCPTGCELYVDTSTRGKLKLLEKLEWMSSWENDGLPLDFLRRRPRRQSRPPLEF